MPYAYPEIKTMRGLYQQRNSFTVPDGALETALNLTVKNDNILSSRRGFHIYHEPSSGTLNNLLTYQSVLMAVYNDKITYFTDSGSEPNKTGTETALTGATVLNSNNRISRSVKSNSNLYNTSDNGMLKLTAHNSQIYKVGAPQGLDLALHFLHKTSSNFLGADKIVGYRIVYGYRDSNDNLILGAPSQISEITNNQITLTTQPVVSSTTVTVTQVAHGLETGDFLIFSDAQSGGSTDEPNADGTYAITKTGADTFTYTISTTTSATPLTRLKYAYASPVRLENTIPSEIGSDLKWFAQIYRSSQQSASIGIFSDFKMIKEYELSASEKTAGIFYFDDNTDDILLGAELYTNENSREGELQANYRPPLCDDVDTFKGHTIYAKATTRHLIDASIVSTSSIVNNSYIEIKAGGVTNKYQARTGVGNQTVIFSCSNSSGLLLTYPSHGFVNSDRIRVDNQVGGSLSSGLYYVINKTTDTLQISSTDGGSAISHNSETSCEVQGVTISGGTVSMFAVSSSGSASIRLRVTAESLVKAINRDSDSLIYAEYVSTINDIPGKMRFQAKGFGDPISFLAENTNVGNCFSPSFPTSFDPAVATQVISQNEQLPHTFYASKEGEPEAVPLVNRFPVGSKNSDILRIKALRDSLIMLKGDGVWRVTGDSVFNFQATLIDGTVICVAPDSVDVINNQVAFLSNQGVCFVTESSVQIISREGIEDPLQPILGQSNLSNQTSGVAYESERLYLLTTTEPNTTVRSVTYAYNILTQEWTTWDRLMSGGVVGPNDKLYYIENAGNDIYRERKNEDRTDYADHNYASTLNAVDNNTITLTISGGGIPKKGDMIVQENVISRIATDPKAISGVQYTFDVNPGTNLNSSDTPVLYSGFERKIKLAPFHAGLIGRLKLFSQMQIHMRNSGMSKCEISFSGQTFGGSQVIEWEAQNASSGWGFFPWGFDVWGQESGLNLTIGTQPSPVVRIYLGRFQARNTFIQPIISHVEAGEQTNIQGMSFAARPYGERVST